MPVPAHRHRTPSPPPRPRIIIKKQPAPRIRAPLHGRMLPFHYQLRRRSRNRRQQPFQPALSPNKLHPPTPFSRHQFIVSFRNPQNLVDRCHPRLRKLSLRFNCGEHRSYTLPQPQDLQEHRIHCPRLAPLQRLEPHPPFFADHLRIHQEVHELRPRKVMCRRDQIGKIQRQASRNQFWRCRLGSQSRSFFFLSRNSNQFSDLCRLYSPCRAQCNISKRVTVSMDDYSRFNEFLSNQRLLANSVVESLARSDRGQSSPF
jgi:hypothetical protein